MEIILGIITLMGGAIIVLLKKLSKIESDKKLTDIAIQDAKQEESQAQVRQEKDVLKKELKKIDEQKAEDLSDEDIEKYWRNK
jgi:hypothetical protein